MTANRTRDLMAAIEELQGRPIWCECCGRSLKGKRVKWLELNCDTGRWSDPDAGMLSADESQGFFTFGAACAKRKLKAD
jgi:hypothetical protein